MSHDIRVRPATLDDAALLVEMNAAMARETEDKGLDRAALDRGVRRALAEPARARYLVAELDGDAAGALMLTREWSDWRDAWFWWIQSVYVLPRARRHGVYRALHEEVRRQAVEARDVCGVRLYVEHENERAQATYAAMGMRPSHYRIYEETLG